jgi:hypothetical protein
MRTFDARAVEVPRLSSAAIVAIGTLRRLSVTSICRYRVLRNPARPSPCSFDASLGQGAIPQKAHGVAGYVGTQVRTPIRHFHGGVPE